MYFTIDAFWSTLVVFRLKAVHEPSNGSDSSSEGTPLAIAQAISWFKLSFKILTLSASLWFSNLPGGFRCPIKYSGVAVISSSSHGSSRSVVITGA